MTAPELQRMAAALQRRGPDASGIWRGTGVGVGHCMLRTTPESLGESPPLVSADGRKVLSADVRLDNRDILLGTLRTHLQAAPRPAAEIGDHELILAAYEKWGDECPQHLIGDFAFAIWDQSRRAVFCARDPFGARPLHYFRSDRLFVFASEVKAVLGIAEVPGTLNQGRIADYLVDPLEIIDQTSTFYRDIHRLPPATALLVDRRGARQERYWRPDPGRSLVLKTDAEYTEAFLDVFSTAVACRLRSLRAPASTLSGGIDSSAVTAVARDIGVRQGLDPLHTVSAVSDRPEGCVESQAALAVIGQGNLIPHTVMPAELARFETEMEEFLADSDDLFAVSRAGVPHAVYCTAKENGINVLLDGIDGDLVTSAGTHYLAYLLRDGHWGTAISEARAHSRNYYRNTMSAFSLLARNARTAFVPHAARKQLRRVRTRQALQKLVRNSLINPSFADEVDLHHRVEMLNAHLRIPLAASLRAHQAGVLDRPIIPTALERYDRQAALLSVEARHPFMDVRLVEFCLALPWHQHVRNGFSKFILRQAMERRVPESVRWRVGGWEHLGAEFKPVWERLRSVESLRACISQRQLLQRYIKPAVLDRLLQLQPQNLLSVDAATLGHLTIAGTLAQWLARTETR